MESLLPKMMLARSRQCLLLNRLRLPMPYSSVRQSPMFKMPQPLMIQNAPTKFYSTESDPPKKVERPESMGTRGTKEYGKNKTPVGWVNLAVSGFILVVLYVAYRYAKVK